MGDYLKDTYLITCKVWSWFKNNVQVCETKSEEDWTKLLNELDELLKELDGQLARDLVKAYLKEFERRGN